MDNRELNQAAFEKVVRHLLKQGAKSMVVGIDDEDALTCAYRGPGGRMCAVGCLMSDEDYRPGLEGMAASRLRDLPSLAGLSVGLLSSLQTVHDQNEPDEWHDRLVAVAAEYGLTMPDLEPSSC